MVHNLPGQNWYYFSTASAERMIEKQYEPLGISEPINGSFYLNGPVTNGAQLIITDQAARPYILRCWMVQQNCCKQIWQPVCTISLYWVAKNLPPAW